jgi:hypothetical protein
VIATVIRRCLNLLFKFRIYNKHFVITYNGDISSANKIWSGVHFSVRSAMKNKYAKIFNTLLLEAKVKKMDEMSLVTFYRSRHDVDNLSSLTKVMADCIKGSFIEDDNPKFYKSTHTIFDESLPKGTIEFHLIGK